MGGVEPKRWTPALTVSTDYHSPYTKFNVSQLSVGLGQAYQIKSRLGAGMVNHLVTNTH